MNRNLLHRFCNKFHQSQDKMINIFKDSFSLAEKELFSFYLGTNNDLLKVGRVFCLFLVLGFFLDDTVYSLYPVLGMSDFIAFVVT